MVDVLVVGSGAGAAPLSFKLAQKGFKVLALEKGDWLERSGLSEDELAQLTLEVHRPHESMDPTVVYSDNKLVSDESRVGQAFYLVGGGTVRYTGASWRFRKSDFKKLSTYGAVEGSSLADWPITYEEIESYYSEAEREVGISGLPGIDPTEPPRSKNFMMPPLAEDRFQHKLAEAGRKLGWTPFPIPFAIHSMQNERTNGRQCMQCGWCSGYPCLFQAKSAVDITIFPRAKATSHFTLRTHAYVTQILMDKKKERATGVEYLNLKTGKREAVYCKYLVLAASAIQTSRLLLMSSGGRFKNGLANSSGKLGRNLMFHIEAKGSAVFEEEYGQGFYKKVAFHDHYYPKKEDGFINHRSIQSGSKASPIAFALGKKGFGTSYLKELQQKFVHTQEVQCMVEDLPLESNFVSLSKTKKDLWGYPAPEVHHKYHEHDRKAVQTSLVYAQQLLEAAGGKDIEMPQVHDNITGRYTWHLMGTARMGTDPATSVVNRDLQTHDHKNIFIADASPFPTSAGLNPTLTIQAFSFRLGDRLPELIKEGRV